MRRSLKVILQVRAVAVTATVRATAGSHSPRFTHLTCMHIPHAHACHGAPPVSGFVLER